MGRVIWTGIDGKPYDIVLNKAIAISPVIEGIRKRFGLSSNRFRVKRDRSGEYSCRRFDFEEE
ncbi:MAG: hypothetical protein FWE22_08200 [Firmicutes bacterium]|nr:hypothetical protein [Bacillota bacterium]